MICIRSPKNRNGKTSFYTKQGGSTHNDQERVSTWWSLVYGQVFLSGFIFSITRREILMIINRVTTITRVSPRTLLFLFFPLSLSLSLSFFSLRHALIKPHYTPPKNTRKLRPTSSIERKSRGQNQPSCPVSISRSKHLFAWICAKEKKKQKK